MTIDTRSLNLNSYGILIGFLITFAGLVANYTGIQYAQTATAEWQEAHEAMHRDIQASSSARQVLLDAEIAALKLNQSKAEQLEWRHAQLEKALENTDTRLNRISESYSNQFADFRTQMSSLSTQIALAIQTLQRIENSGQTSAQTRNP